MPFKPSPYQQAIFDSVTKLDSSLLIEAVAGSGKTTTLVKAVELLPAWAENVIVLAFNKRIATEMSEKLPVGVEAATFHSIMFRAVKGRFGNKIKVDANKVRKIWWSMRDSKVITQQENEDYGQAVVKLVGMAKNAGLGVLTPKSVESWQDLIDRYDVDVNGTANTTVERAIELANKLFNLNNAATDVIDFDDMIWYPILYDLPMRDFYGLSFICDVVMIDEAQDTNAVQRACLKKLINPKIGRLIAVGDTSQSIYGFRGADSDAMHLIEKEFNCQRLPLSISYRCPQAVVRAAQAYTPAIECSPTAIEGSVTTRSDVRITHLQRTDVVLCRNTAPLVQLAYKCIAQRVGVRIAGRDIGQGLITLIKKLKARDTDDLITKINAWQSRETEKAIKQQQDAKIGTIEDKAQSLMAIIDAATSTRIDDLIQMIEELFDDSNNRGLLTLSTGHRSKGLEWNTVYILDQHLCPSRWAKTPEQIQQEYNLSYVMITRAQQNLIYVDSKNLQ